MCVISVYHFTPIFSVSAAYRAYKHTYNGVGSKGGVAAFPPENSADLYSPAYSLDQPRSESAMGK